MSYASWSFNKLVPSGPLWIQPWVCRLIVTVQKVLGTGNDIIWVVYLPLDTEDHCRLHPTTVAQRRVWNPTGQQIPCQTCIPAVACVRSGQRGAAPHSRAMGSFLCKVARLLSWIAAITVFMTGRSCNKKILWSQLYSKSTCWVWDSW